MTADAWRGRNVTASASSQTAGLRRCMDQLSLSRTESGPLFLLSAVPTHQVLGCACLLLFKQSTTKCLMTFPTACLTPCWAPQGNAGAQQLLPRHRTLTLIFQLPYISNIILYYFRCTVLGLGIYRIYKAISMIVLVPTWLYR